MFMERIRGIDLLLLAALALPFAATAKQEAGGIVKVFSCEINGRPVFGDTLPKECYGRAWVQRINGVVVHREEAQPTPDESAMRREAARQREQARQEALRQKQRDDALRERYSTLADLDQRRDRELGELDNAIADLRVEERELFARRRGIDEEIKALGDKPVVADLTKALSYADEELARARAAIERKVTERDNLRQRYDEDRRHYIEITTSVSPGK
jgi:chromosome segregation ATPase